MPSRAAEDSVEEVPERVSGIVTVGALMRHLAQVDPSLPVEVEVRNHLGARQQPKAHDLTNVTVRRWMDKATVELLIPWL